MAKKDYDWLNDPFDEKKAAQEQVEAGVSTGTKLALGCGCLVILIGVVVLVVLGMSMLGAMAV